MRETIFTLFFSALAFAVSYVLSAHLSQTSHPVSTEPEPEQLKVYSAPAPATPSLRDLLAEKNKQIQTLEAEIKNLAKPVDDDGAVWLPSHNIGRYFYSNPFLNLSWTYEVLEINAKTATEIDAAVKRAQERIEAHRLSTLIITEEEEEKDISKPKPWVSTLSIDLPASPEKGREIYAMFEAEVREILAEEKFNVFRDVTSLGEAFPNMHFDGLMQDRINFRFHRYENGVVQCMRSHVYKNTPHRRLNYFSTKKKDIPAYVLQRLPEAYAFQLR